MHSNSDWQKDENLHPCEDSAVSAEKKPHCWSIAFKHPEYFKTRDILNMAKNKGTCFVIFGSRENIRFLRKVMGSSDIVIGDVLRIIGVKNKLTNSDIRKVLSHVSNECVRGS